MGLSHLTVCVTGFDPQRGGTAIIAFLAAGLSSCGEIRDTYLDLCCAVVDFVCTSAVNKAVKLSCLKIARGVLFICRTDDMLEDNPSLGGDADGASGLPAVGQAALDPASCGLVKDGTGVPRACPKAANNPGLGELVIPAEMQRKH